MAERRGVAAERGGEHPIVVVGAGLVGSLLAIYLARRGYSVEVYERRPDMRREEISAGRSINLALSLRGIHALRQVGLDAEVLALAIPMRGRVIHPFTENPQAAAPLAFQPYGKGEDDCINSVSRGALNRILMDHAERTGRCRFHFNRRVDGIDLRARRLELRDERTGERSEVAYERVIGTDGSASAIRAELIRHPGRDFSQEYLEHGYKELTLPPGPDGAFQLERNALHIWPRRDYMLIALPNPGGSFTCTLFLSMVSDAPGRPSFETLHDPAAVDAFFRREFPDAHRLMPSLAEEFFAHPTGHMVTTRCRPWNHGGDVLLLGDAAHAIVPFFGQGMNCGFEDCAVLDAHLEASGGDWARAFDDFARARKPDADAIAAMALENFVEMRDKVGDPRFLLEKQVEMGLQKRFPDRYLSRYAMVTFTRLPYRLALEAGRAQDTILADLCRGLDRAEDADWERARALIDARLSPLLAGSGAFPVASR